MPEPVAFMVMPFNRKPTGRGEAHVPSQVDFDLLWFRVYRPVLADLGYRPIRADADVGALIITEMIQRLVLGDLVVADVSLPNANVYYEVGVRHAASRVGCVLVAAEWAQPVFDIGQMRQVRYPLDDGALPSEAADRARAALAAGLGPLTEGISPVYTAVPGYPSTVDRAKFPAFADLADELMAFDADVRTAYLASAVERRDRALEVVERHGHKNTVRHADALLLLRVLRDLVGWRPVLDYIATLPRAVAEHPLVLEQQCLALAKSGDVAGAAARLVAVIERHGETSERLGLLGGRYKQLWREATDAAERRRYLDLAIDAYERGTQADLNDYYPASNLPLLYRARGADGDAALAADVQAVTMAACRRTLARGSGDEWVRSTMLSMAFQRGDVAAARELAAAVALEGAVAWRLGTTVQDLRDAVAGQEDDAVRAGLAAVLDELDDLLPQQVAGGGARR
ncbi:tetratricopeptide repeat-containing protein [Georgenia subflava]|uniref:DUF4071 domain-containing protein n=1 Tax=Georgenia subflava TaxID=1622177 RepID=A0A6N7EEU2_9MICO|nr:tetratricopeptide repeat-containing protein [Georgenia subflava]MPV35693.1 hypothetical protein [Georgenia subflava]